MRFSGKLYVRTRSGPVDRADLGLALGARLRVQPSALGRREQSRPQHAQGLLLVLELALSFLAGADDPVGTWVMRTAESVVLTD